MAAWQPAGRAGTQRHSAVNAIIWLAYALVVHDVNILVPNASGVVLGITQLGLYVWLRCLAGSGQTSGLGYTALADGEEVL